LEQLILEKKELEKNTLDDSFWNNSADAQKTLKKITELDNEINFWNKLKDSFSDILLYNEISNIENKFEKEYEELLNNFSDLLDKLEMKKLLSGPDDEKSALLTIHPGAGGTESQDWAEMLFRLYKRWCDKSNYKINVLDLVNGDIAGIKDVSIEVHGKYAYGNLKAEAGVHRLVRISPFDSNSKRHTSFASIFIYPLIDDDFDILIDDKDLRIDTFRASGAGGQHVNKTDSAIRITHIPTNIVVQCQNERSQLKNKNTAMKMLKSKLYQIEIDKKQEEKEKLEGNKKDISWGSQIRSYIFHPYNLVKDHRTNFENNNINSVMDGNINEFIRKYLLSKTERN
tara:strand:- start:1778 stop:2803 length:1026 start_codon:yes stop_codon:yes gene_type:complete